jgi:hypothetical protein
LVKHHFQDQGTLYVSIQPLADALGARATFDTAARTARLEFDAQSARAAEAAGPARVGGLAPDFRLQRLDGTFISLSDLRGKRVVINSWASW